ncbi:MAG: site-specific DNA-methyltransferase [Caldilinea sp. CFX5]|nr:site-specific DNA-methyltransferase [Caldilinea sp. CFX5]
MPAITFKGKSIVHSHHLTIPYRQLLVDETRSLLAPGQPASLKGNVIIQGDNLYALKALIPSFAGKIKCIYIDPPYNTGNEHWVYNDNVAHPMLQEWLHQVVDKEDLTRHDKWLCMMLPRLKLLRELLRDDGVIFISIDDNEEHHLRLLMDEIFGEENFIASVIWQKNYAPKSSAQFFSEDHDYIFVYAKRVESFLLNLLPRTSEQDAIYQNPDNDPRGLWRPNNLSARNYYSKGTYAIRTPGGRIIEGPPKGSYWRISEDKLWELDREGRIWWGKDGNNVPAPKIYMSEVKQGRVSQTLWPYKDVGHTQEAKKELLDLIEFEDSASVFISPKPVRLIKRILQIATEPDSIILDSFAGSGTTAHAVLALNAEDGGNRQFILIEQEDYADTLTAERVRRVIQSVPTARDTMGLGGSFTYCTLGPNFDENELLSGGLPPYQEMARFVFFTATGEQIDTSQIDEASCYLGESSRYNVYLIYQPDIEYLKNTPLDLTFAMNLPVSSGKPRLIIASHKYLDEDRMAEYQIEFCQLPFGIYRYRAE